MFVECSHQEAVKEVVGTLKNQGYIVKTEAWASTTLGGYRNNSVWIEDDLDKWYRDFKFNVANMFLGRNSPWISLHNPEFQTRLDVVGLYYADCEGLPMYTFFVRKDPTEVALRTVLIEVEHRHSIEEAIKRIKGYPAGKKIIVWTGGDRGGMLEDIPITVARNNGFGCYIPKLLEILEEHIREIKERKITKV